MNTNVPSIEFTSTGLVLPTEQEILNGVLADFNEAFGGNLNLSLETPQGQLASSIAAMIANKNNQIAWVVNSLDIDYAEDFMQDAIAKIYDISRQSATDSTVTVTFTGLSGTIIPKGFIVTDANGVEWTTSSQSVIGVSGTVQTKMISGGVIYAEINTVTKIKNALVGLDSATNAEAATVGRDIESRQRFAERYKKSVAKNSLGMIGAVYANIADLPGVTDCYVIENVKDSAVTVGSTNYTLSPHSVYVAVSGGDDETIAKSIWKYSGNGCDFNGNTTITVKDETYDDPQPEYEIKFMRPIKAQLYVRVSLRRGGSASYEQLVKAQLLKTFSALDKVMIGSTIYIQDFIVELIANLKTEKILDVDLSTDNVTYGNYAAFGVDQIPTLSEANITVTTA